MFHARNIWNPTNNCMQSFIEFTLAHLFADYFGVESVGSVRGRERIHWSQTTVEKHGYWAQCNGIVGMMETEEPPTGNGEWWFLSRSCDKHVGLQSGKSGWCLDLTVWYEMMLNLDCLLEVVKWGFPETVWVGAWHRNSLAGCEMGVQWAIYGQEKPQSF